MKRAVIFLALAAIVAATSTVVLAEGNGGSDGDDRSSIFRRTNFSNEFGLETPEGINARGKTTVRSTSGTHHVRIRANGLTPGREYVIINHFFEPVPGRGVGPSLPSEDPSCNGHYQFIGPGPVAANVHGKLKVTAKVDQLAPHIWVVDLAAFLDATASGTQAPANPDSFVTGGLLIPFDDLTAAEGDFVDAAPLTDCS